MKKNKPILLALVTTALLFTLAQTPTALGHSLSITLTPTESGPKPTATNSTFPTRPLDPTATVPPTLPPPSPTPTPKIKPPKAPTATINSTETASQVPTIIKSVSVDTVTVGDILIFELTITNPTGEAITNVQVVDPLPAEVNFIDATVSNGTFNYDVDSHTITLDVGTLEAGGTITLTIQVRVNELGTAPAEFSNTAILVSTEYSQIESNTVTLFSIPTGVPVTGRVGNNNLDAFPILIGTLFLVLMGLLRRHYLTHWQKKNP